MITTFEVRNRLGLTQKQLAEKLDITIRQLSRYETGHSVPLVVTLALEALMRRAGRWGEEQQSLPGLDLPASSGELEAYEIWEGDFIDRKTIVHALNESKKHGWHDIPSNPQGPIISALPVEKTLSNPTGYHFQLHPYKEWPTLQKMAEEFPGMLFLCAPYVPD